MFKSLLALAAVALSVATASAKKHELRGSISTVTQLASEAICDNVVQHSGYFNLTTGDKHYFYWFFESRSNPSTDPVVMWMTGGPGCSSEVALFGENGPCKVSADGSVRILVSICRAEHGTTQTLLARGHRTH